MGCRSLVPLVWNFPLPERLGCLLGLWNLSQFSPVSWELLFSILFFFSEITDASMPICEISRSFPYLGEAARKTGMD